MLILHGENIVLSRKRLVEKSENFSGEIIKLSGNELSLTDLKQAIESQSLFGKEKLVVIENFFSRRPSREKRELLEYCKKNNPSNLLIWEGKTIDGRILNSFFQAKKECFKLSSLVFKFLDSFSPFNKKSSLALFHQCLKQNPVEIIFFLLAQQVNQLIIAADLGERGLIDLPAWKRKKLIIQAEKFGLKKLISLFQQLLKIDYQQKIGHAPFDLVFQLDLLLANL